MCDSHFPHIAANMRVALRALELLDQSLCQLMRTDGEKARLVMIGLQKQVAQNAYHTLKMAMSEFTELQNEGTPDSETPNLLRKSAQGGCVTQGYGSSASDERIRMHAYYDDLCLGAMKDDPLSRAASRPLPQFDHQEKACESLQPTGEAEGAPSSSPDQGSNGTKEE